MEAAFDMAYDVPVNWKVYVENALEGYHLPFVHDLFEQMVDSRRARHFLEAHASYSLSPIRPETLAMIPAPVMRRTLATPTAPVMATARLRAAHFLQR